jgi:predicted DNA-binding protein
MTKKKRGRPALDRPATTRIHACVTEDAAEALRAAAEATDRTVSTCVREAVEAWLERQTRPS